MVLENNIDGSSNGISYQQIYAVIESKAYFIFYWTKRQVSAIHKKDLVDIDELKQFIVKHLEEKYQQM